MLSQNDPPELVKASLKLLEVIFGLCEFITNVGVWLW